MRRLTVISGAALAVIVVLFLLDGPVWTLAAPGGIDPAVRSAIGRLHSWRGSTRAAATADLRNMGPGAPPAAPALVEHLDDIVCVHVSEVLTAIGPGAAPALIAGLKNPREHVRAISAELLASQPASSESLTALRYTALHDPGPAVQNAAAGTLSKHHDIAILGEVARRLRDPDVRKRAMAVLLLESLSAPNAVTLVEPALQDPDLSVRQTAGYALQRLEKRQ